jgi:hypothetical protein
MTSLRKNQWRYLNKFARHRIAFFEVKSTIQGILEVDAFLVTRGTTHYS